MTQELRAGQSWWPGVWIRAHACGCVSALTQGQVTGDRSIARAHCCQFSWEWASDSRTVTADTQHPLLACVCAYVCRHVPTLTDTNKHTNMLIMKLPMFQTKEIITFFHKHWAVWHMFGIIWQNYTRSKVWKTFIFHSVFLRPLV